MTIKSARLDLQGGIAGDMFIAAMIDVLPELETVLREALQKLPLPPSLRYRIEPFHDGMFGGHKFHVDLSDLADHTNWKSIRAMLRECSLDEQTRNLALKIFGELAEAEATIHQKPIEDVVFHEVGAWDSIIDIVAASALVAHSGIQHWATSPIPLGFGTVQSHHGLITMPAPATRLLLEGFHCVDDGIGGERVTPTGAALLRSIVNTTSVKGQMSATGAGFGQKKLKGTSNCVWISILEANDLDLPSDQVDQINFEVDDATPEALSVGLERLRQTKGVIDVIEWAAIGKKARMAHAVQILCNPSETENVAQACFEQTSTLGLRINSLARRTLPRDIQSFDKIRVKTADRPGGYKTSKADIDDVASRDTHAERTSLANQMEARALNDES